MRKPLTDEEYRQAVLRSRSMSGEEKILEGERLFEQECEEMAAAIRKEFPGATEDIVNTTLSARLDERRLQEDKEISIRMSEVEREESLKGLPITRKPIK